MRIAASFSFLLPSSPLTAAARGRTSAIRRNAHVEIRELERQDFIKTLAEACQKTNSQVQAYCLMPNHYHLAMETPEPNLVARMDGKLGDHHSGELPRASAEAKAVQIIAQELHSGRARRKRTCSSGPGMTQSSWRSRRG